MIISPFVFGLKKIDSGKDSDKKSLCEYWGRLIVFAKNICAHEKSKKGSFKKII